MSTNQTINLFLLHPQWFMYDEVTTSLPESLVMPIHQVELTTSQSRFISKEVKSGRYRDESEVHAAGLRLLEVAKKREQQKLKTLRAMVQQGVEQIDQGKGILLSGDQELRQFIRALGEKARERGKQKNKRMK
jgi:putative addiction module CopG family antidote